MKPPRIIKPHVEAFARKVIGTSGIVELSYLPCRPLNRISDGDCFPWVEDHAKTNGGMPVLGWAIWEFPKVFIEAEFHSVWLAPDGVLHDIVPRQQPPIRILFVRDPRRRYLGRQVDNVRKALTHDKNVEEFLRLKHKMFRLQNEGDLADYHGPIESILTREMIAVDEQEQLVGQKLFNRYGPWLPEECETD
jgi:hypothetical protein